jgi:hypothetical protein
MGRSRKYKSSSNQRTIINAPTPLHYILHDFNFDFHITQFDSLHIFRILAYNTSFSVYSFSSTLDPLFDLTQLFDLFFYDLDALRAWYSDSLCDMANRKLMRSHIILSFFTFSMLLRCSFMQICVHVHAPTLVRAMKYTIRLLSAAWTELGRVIRCV